MKPRDLLACCFAGYGVYLAFSGLVAAIATAAGMVSIARNAHESLSFSQIVQYLFSIYPFLMGLLLATFSGALGRLAARFAALNDASSWTVPVSSRELFAALIAVVGSYLLATHCGEIIRQLIFVFLAKAGDRDTAEMTTRLGANPSFLITYIGNAAVGVVLMFKCMAIAKRLMPQEKLANHPPLQTPASGTPAAGAPVAPPPGAAGR